MRALVVGYFSTFGDLEVLRWVERQLTLELIPYDICAYSRKINKHIPNPIDIQSMDPTDYTHLCVVGGPFKSAVLKRKGLKIDQFEHCVRIGVNLTILDSGGETEPLDALLGRDCSQWSMPDISFLEDVDKVPAIGLCLVDEQKEYGARQQHKFAQTHFAQVLERAGMSAIDLDTRWPVDRNAAGISSVEMFESICSRLDVVLTTRLHGMVLSLKNGTPALGIDPVLGGDKVIRQARAIGWPEAFVIDEVTPETLDSALSRCLLPEAKQRAHTCAAFARELLISAPEDFSRMIRT